MIDLIRKFFRKENKKVVGEYMNNDVRFYVGKCKHLIAVWKGAHYHTGISLTELHLRHVEGDEVCGCYIVDPNQKRFKKEPTK